MKSVDDKQLGDKDIEVQDDGWDSTDEDELVVMEGKQNDGEGSSQTVTVNLNRNGQIVVDNWLNFLVPYHCLSQIVVLRLRIQKAFLKLVESRVGSFSREDKLAIDCATKLFEYQNRGDEISLGHSNQASKRSSGRSDKGRENNKQAGGSRPNFVRGQTRGGYGRFGQHQQQRRQRVQLGNSGSGVGGRGQNYGLIRQYKQSQNNS
eukprot:TRINITY_DN4257_c0_g1_i8.p2 TRINITY_DN4257_c0_g1~~TRINITY_DN4257_c0_g1_i8.p2  ORF type:complete len:206 (+),score=32.76 TRINITY_DN4257_c0_g1_i8:15-632(+)